MKKVLTFLLAMVVLGLSVSQVYAEDLELLSWNWKQPYKAHNNYVVATGEIKNISDHPIKWIRVITSFYDKDGTFMTSDRGFVEYNPIMPNQVSPFNVLVQWNPLMFTAKIEFQYSDPYGDKSGMKIPCRYKVKNIKKMD